jgi:gluconate 2-dehydrogenase gamma chain
MASPPDSNRRNFLKGTLAIAPLAMVGSASAQETPAKDDLRLSAPQPATPYSADYRPSFFNPTEWAFVTAAADRIIPHDENGPGAVELGVPEYIDRQMQTPYAEGAIWYMQGPFPEAAAEFGYQSKLTPREQYRLGIPAINAHCQTEFGKIFADLTPAQQDDVLKRVESGQIKSDDAPLRTFFSSFLLRHVMEGYFGDPMYGGNKDMGSWKMIAYPGVRADYMDWVDQYGRRYPYGPVSIYGRRG